jgi:hypothetical protein
LSGDAMTIEEKMKQVLEKYKGPDSPDFQSLRDFYEEKKKEGLVRKQEYNIPPMDTVGRVLYVRQREKADK